jgi:hypothetical protein
MTRYSVENGIPTLGVALADHMNLEFFSRYDGLMFVRVTPLGAYCLGAASDYAHSPGEVKPVLQVLPNLEINRHR